jgi:hypothetical protein
MTEGPLTNGHDKSEDVPLSDSIEAAHGAIILKQQITELQITAARASERATVEALVQDAMRKVCERRASQDDSRVKRPPVCSLTEHASRSWPTDQCTPPRTPTRAEHSFEQRWPTCVEP